MATATLNTEFAKALGCKEKFVQTRLVALGHGEVCGRCGGSGHYSYCPMYGTTCFKCMGCGKQARKLTAKLLNTVQAQVANGELIPYVEKLKAAAERKAKVKGFMDKFFAAWKANPSVAAGIGKHFMQCLEREHEINRFVAPMCDEAGKLVTLVEKGEWSKEYRGYVVASEENQTKAIARLAEIMEMARNAETLAPVGK